MFKSKDELNYFLKTYHGIVITNNSDNIQYDNIADIRIFNWLINNYSDHNYLCYITDIDKEKVLELVNAQKVHIKNNYDYFFEKCLEYTKYYKNLNKLFKLEYNESYYYNLTEKMQLDYDIKKKIEGQKVENLITLIDKNLSYSFLTPNTKIYPTSTFLQKIDRKNHIDLFKTDKNKNYYLIDFKNFEVRPLYFYTKNEEYISDKFYDIYSKKYKIERSDFKNKFLAWLNGAGENLLQNLLYNFNNDFKDIVQLKQSMKNGKFVNYFEHCCLYEQDYKKLGLLITSTSYDFLLRFYNKCYNKFKDDVRIKFRFNLFDEFFIETDKDFGLNELPKNNFFTYKINEV
jgi:hypothetical protein